MDALLRVQPDARPCSSGKTARTTHPRCSEAHHYGLHALTFALRKRPAIIGGSPGASGNARAGPPPPFGGMLLLMLRQRWRSTLGGEGHGLAWQVANIALFVLALVAALAVIFGVMIGIWLLASRGS